MRKCRAPSLVTISRGLIFTAIILALVLPACNRSPESGQGAGPKEVTYSVASKDIQIPMNAWESELPADIILVIDQSGSMSRGKNPTDPKALRIEGSRSFLEFVASRSRAAQPNRFGVVNFGSEASSKQAAPLVAIASPDDPNVARITAQLIPLNLGDTNFNSAIKVAVDLLRQGGSFQEQRNRAIVVFTDGEPDDRRRLSRRAYFEELKNLIDREVKPNKISLFIIGIDSEGKRWSETVPAWKELVGADHVFTTASMEALREQFNRIVQRIWHLPEVGSVVVSSQSPMEFEIEPYLAAVEFHLFPGEKGLSLQIFRPSGAMVKPGSDKDTLPIKHLATGDRITIQEPEPGRWRYEVVGGAGKVEVLRNPIPLRMQLISPARIHPQGKPMRIVAEFKRTDGKPVTPQPDYPLGLTAEVLTPEGRRFPVKFSLDQQQQGIFVGEPVLDNTMTVGDYLVTLKVSGGGRYQNQNPVAIQVQPIPYLQVIQPTYGATLPPAAQITVQAQLLQAGKPLRPTEGFKNHPDYLVIAQVLPKLDGPRGKAVWVNAKDQNSGEFEGIVPLPQQLEGDYALALKLAPEEAAKMPMADQTVVEFHLRKPPMALWAKVALWLLITVPLVVLAAWQVRRRQQRRLRFSLYYWPENQSRYQVILFTRAQEIKSLPDLPLNVTRLGGEKAIRFTPLPDVKLMTADGQEIQELTAREGGRVLIQPPDGTLLAVHYEFGQPPTRPQPSAPPPPEDEGPQGPKDEPSDWSKAFGSTT